MKRILLLAFTLISSFQSFAQDPDPELFQTWYLYHISYEDLDPIFVADFDPPITPTLTIMPSLDFIGDGACNTFEGYFTFTPPNFFLTNDFIATTSSCTSEQDMFEQSYFNFINNGSELYYTITIEANGTRILDIYDLIFNGMRFKNIPLATNDFSKGLTSIYPNPVSETLFISSENIPIQQMSIYSLSGKKVMEVSENTGSIDVSSLSEGMYFLEIFSEGGKSVKKFIKE